MDKGIRWDGDRLNRTERNFALKFAEDNVGELKAAGLPRDDIIHAWKVQGIALDELNKMKTHKPKDSSPRSAYDVIYRNLEDSDASAQYMSAFFDTMGYHTALIAVPGHAEVEVKIGGI